MEQILLAYGLSKETVVAIMMLFKNMKAIVCSPDGNTKFFNIVAWVLQGHTFMPYTFIISLDNVLQTSFDLTKENVLTKKGKK